MDGADDMLGWPAEFDLVCRWHALPLRQRLALRVEGSLPSSA
jgi:hypothetical protein